MNNILDLSVKEINELLIKKEITPTMILDETFKKIEENSDLNAFITLDKENAYLKAKELENMEVDNLLFGLPIAIKDNICTKDLKTTCASLMLDNFIPIYDADVITKIKSKNMIIIGKTNMDEFAFGSTSRTSYYGAPKNPVDKTRIAGGSSGGSASCVGAGLTRFALGSDTGGSIRQPASYTGIYGMKPTYGRVSRYGLIAFASSLDQIGPMTTNTYDNALLLNIICGKSNFDLTSVDKEAEDFTRKIGEDIKGMKIAVPNYFMSDIVNDEIKERINKVIDFLKEKGATVDYIDIRHLDQAVTLYQIIAMGEASSNLARFDGVKYGLSTKDAENVDDLYKKTRSKGFGQEVKRRIMVGSFILSGENAKTYYNKAMMVRQDMANSFEEAFNKYDLIIGPTTTTVAYKLDEDMSDPLKSFMDDVLVIPVNMAGLPAMSIPVGVNCEKMPIGLHIIGKKFDEATIYKLASFIEKEGGFNE